LEGRGGLWGSPVEDSLGSAPGSGLLKTEDFGGIRRQRVAQSSSPLAGMGGEAESAKQKAPTKKVSSMVGAGG